jgi:hypothetical protein
MIIYGKHVTIHAATPWAPSIDEVEHLARLCTADDAPCAACLAGKACEGPAAWLLWLPGDEVAEDKESAQ